MTMKNLPTSTTQSQFPVTPENKTKPELSKIVIRPCENCKFISFLNVPLIHRENIYSIENTKFPVNFL